MTTHDTAQAEIRKYLSRHAAEAVRPVPLAQRLGLRDIRVVRAVLLKMANAGELVSCTVIKDGIEDREYRWAAGPQPFYSHRSLQVESAPRRPDASTVPSRLTDLPPGERSSIRLKREVTYVQDVTREAPPRDAPPRHDASPSPRKGRTGGVWNGTQPSRREPVLAFVRSCMPEPVTTARIHQHFVELGEPTLDINAIANCVSKLTADGLLERTKEPVAEPLRGGRLVPGYIIPSHARETAAAALEDVLRPASAVTETDTTMGSGGEGTPAAQPVTAEPAQAPSAPRVSGPTPQKTAQDAPRGPRIDARALLHEFIGRAPKSAYSLSTLVRVAGGDTPRTLELVAHWMREGRLELIHVDVQLPAWRAVEGRW